MMTPRWPSSSTGSWPDIASAARRMTLNVPTRLTEMQVWKRSSGCTPFFDMMR